MTGSYMTDCESCSRGISAGWRYCPDCGTEQQRAVDAIERMRNSASSKRGVSDGD